MTSPIAEIPLTFVSNRSLTLMSRAPSPAPSPRPPARVTGPRPVATRAGPPQPGRLPSGVWESRSHAVASGFRGRDFRPGHHFDALLLERAFELGRHCPRLRSAPTSEELDDRHVAAEAPKIEANSTRHRAASHDHDRLRNVPQADRFVARDNPLLGRSRCLERCAAAGRWPR